MKIQVSKAPPEGQILDVRTSSPPAENSQIEIVRGKTAVAIGLVIQIVNKNWYKVLVVSSEAGAG